MIWVDFDEWMEGVKEINKELNAGKPSLTELVNRQIEDANKDERTGSTTLQGGNTEL